MIEARHLTRRYGPALAVDDVSFSIGEGEIVGFLGPNGAGKTTTLRMVTGFLPPSAGRVTVAGHDLATEPERARGQIGYLPENVALYPEMRVEEYLAYRARLQGLGRADARRAIDRAIERCLLEEVRRQVIGTLSKGYRQRVGLAQAILHRPRVLVLDEPTVGLDPKQIVAIRDLIRELGGERTLLLSTHILPEVELLCDRILIIDRGKVVGEGTAEELRARLAGAAVVRVGLAAPAPDAGERLGALPGVEAVRRLAGHRGEAGEAGEGGEGGGPGERYELEIAAGADPRPAIFATAVERGWTLIELVRERASLEDIFLRLTTRDRAADPPAPAPDPAGPIEPADEPPAAPANEAAEAGEEET